MARFIRIRGLTRKGFRVGNSPNAKQVTNNAETIVDLNDTPTRVALQHHATLGAFVVAGTSPTADGGSTVVSGGVGSAGSGLSVNTSAGEIRRDDGVYKALTAGTNTALGANSSGNPRIDLVQVDGTNGGAVAVTAGTPAASPVAPTTPAGKVPLYTVAVADSASAPGTITDVRPRP